MTKLIRSPDPDNTVTAKSDIRAFWGAMYRSAYSGIDDELDGETLLRLLDETRSMFRYRRHIAATEMPLESLAGKKVLEVGSGGGSHSALFANHGATVTAIDLTMDRARATAGKFELLADRAAGCHALQGDAENLPFSDSTFDIVYSNGVLHHSPDTEMAISEVFRVLRPGGRAIVMLYCKSSINFWLTFWLGYGIFRGGLWRHGVDRLGAQTEWAGSDEQTLENPITRCYTRRQIADMFNSFGDVTLRKSDFSIVHLPKIGKYYRRWLERRQRVHSGGLLPYGAPWPIASVFELWVGQFLGWAWNIAATKPAMEPGQR